MSNKLHSSKVQMTNSYHRIAAQDKSVSSFIIKMYLNQIISKIKRDRKTRADCWCRRSIQYYRGKIN